MLPSVLIIDIDDAASSDLLLHRGDFPENYVNMAHPNDGKIVTTPITPELIRHSRLGHFRMLFRVSFRLGENGYVSYTFVCVTGAPMHFYFHEQALAVLEAAGRIETDEFGSSFLTVAGRKASVRVTPQTHLPGNLMGMLMLERLGLRMTEGSFTFAHPLPYL